jgi:uncharacterized protein YukE
MADMTWSEFKVDLAQLHGAIGSVSHESGLIGGYMSQISSQFASVKQEWVAPSEMSFEDVQQWFTRVQGDLHQLLDETVGRLKKAYDNYHAAELANTQNLATNGPGGHGGGSGGGDSGGGDDSRHHDEKPPAHMREALSRAEGREPATAALRDAMAPLEPRIAAQPLQPAEPSRPTLP